MPLQAVLFDAAGTLMRVREPVGVTYTRIAREAGVVADPERVDRAFRQVMQRMPAMVFPDASPDDTVTLERAWWSEVVHRVFATAAPAERFDDFDSFFDTVFEYFADVAAWQVIDEVPATIAALSRRGLKTGMVSNFDHRLPTLLDGLGLSPLLDVIIRPADVGAAKPDPRIFHAALSRLEVAPHDALYVGDDDRDDVDGAVAAGLHAINVTTLPQFNALLQCVDEF